MAELPEDIINGLEKRIRKQVCDEIRDEFYRILLENDGHYSYSQLDDDFNRSLEKIEKL